MKKSTPTPTSMARDLETGLQLELADCQSKLVQIRSNLEVALALRESRVQNKELADFDAFAQMLMDGLKTAALGFIVLQRLSLSSKMSLVQILAHYSSRLNR